MKTIVKSSMRATIPTGQYQNIIPEYEIVSDADEMLTDDRVNAIMDWQMKIINARIEGDFKRVAELKEQERLRREDLLKPKVNFDELVKELQSKGFRFYRRNGLYYVSVTTAMHEEITMPMEKMNQYGSRGTIYHALFEEFIMTGKMLKPEQLAGMKEHIDTVRNGSLQLSLDDIDFESFIENYKDVVSFDKVRPEVLYNDYYVYAGLPDAFGTYEGKSCLYDFKTATNYPKAKVEKYFKQLSAYNMALPKESRKEVLAIIALSKNAKGGKYQIITTTDTDKYFQMFLKDRADFRVKFGI